LIELEMQCGVNGTIYDILERMNEDDMGLDTIEVFRQTEVSADNNFNTMIYHMDSLRELEMASFICDQDILPFEIIFDETQLVDLRKVTLHQVNYEFHMVKSNHHIRILELKDSDFVSLIYDKFRGMESLILRNSPEYLEYEALKIMLTKRLTLRDVHIHFPVDRILVEYKRDLIINRHQGDATINHAINFHYHEGVMEV
jgi:hypothetical protein